jgi:beta-galactosidase
MSNFSEHWLFGGRYRSGAEAPGHPDGDFAEVTLPHTVTPLSWGDWDPRSWQRTWIYRKHFDHPGASGHRVFLDFQGVMTNATVYLNGVEISHHRGGYLPWSVELTPHLAPQDNVLAIVVDARWLEVPPGGDPGGPKSIDYLQPGGLYRDVALRTVPDTFISDVFAKPTDVLSAGPRVEIEATIDAATVPRGPVTITADLLDGPRTLASAATAMTITASGSTVATLTITGIGDVTRWSPDTPKLYEVKTTATGADSHALGARIGFRHARFERDGFYLNGERLQIFGLNRHQLYPYLGMAAPARLQRRDAELLRQELNCNMVRCSHYPHSPHFLDACDELGLMVWEEIPGWQYVGGREFQGLVLENVRDMVVRDRNRPSVVVWGTRVNESENQPSLYARTRQLAHALDGSRQTSGAMTSRSTEGWTEEVFAYDDYHSSGGDAVLEPPVAGVPYMVSEAVGALSGEPRYRWIDSEATLALQGKMHAQVHDIAASDPAYAGLLGWAGIDYPSLNGGRRIWRNVKWPGVLDTFRVPKPGAAFYRSQIDPALRPVILPLFFWGPGRPGPARGAMVATNCDRLELYAGENHFATATPDRDRFPHLAHPPVRIDVAPPPATPVSDLRIDGYLGAELVHCVHMSADPERDKLELTVEDDAIAADGRDMTRVTFRAVDAYGNQRPRAGAEVLLALMGPAMLIGDNPFSFATYGGVGGAFVRSHRGRAGVVTVTAVHPTLGRATGTLEVSPPPSQVSPSQ